MGVHFGMWNFDGKPKKCQNIGMKRILAYFCNPKQKFFLMIGFGSSALGGTLKPKNKHHG